MKSLKCIYFFVFMLSFISDTGMIFAGADVSFTQDSSFLWITTLYEQGPTLPTQNIVASVFNPPMDQNPQASTPSESTNVIFQRALEAINVRMKLALDVAKTKTDIPPLRRPPPVYPKIPPPKNPPIPPATFPLPYDGPPIVASPDSPYADPDRCFGNIPQPPPLLRSTRIYTDSKGNVITEKDTDGDNFVDKIEVDTNRDGKVDLIITREIFKNNKGCYMSSITNYSNSKGVIRVESDEDGDYQTDSVEFFDNGDGVLTTRYEKNSKGELVATEHNVDTDDDGILDTRYLSNKSGELTVFEYRSDTDGDGKVDIVTNYNSEGSMVSQTKFTPDGKIDFEINYKNGKPLFIEIAKDTDGNGSLDTSFFISIGSTGSTMITSFSIDTDEDGEDDLDVYIDRNGKIESVSIYLTIDQDRESKTTKSQNLDAKGHLINTVIRVYALNYDGYPSHIISIKILGPKGNLLSTEIDSDGDGNSDMIKKYLYRNNGTLIGGLVYIKDANGVFDFDHPIKDPDPDDDGLFQ